MIRDDIDEHLFKLMVDCLTEDIDNGVMADDEGHMFPFDDQSWIQGYLTGFEKGYKKAKEENEQHI